MNAYHKLIEAKIQRDAIFEDALRIMWGVARCLLSAGVSEEDLSFSSEEDDGPEGAQEVKLPLVVTSLRKLLTSEGGWLKIGLQFRALRIGIPILLKPVPDGTWLLKTALEGKEHHISLKDATALSPSFKEAVDTELAEWAECLKNPWLWEARGGKRIGF